jgi:hypothetical protein
MLIPDNMRKSTVRRAWDLAGIGEAGPRTGPTSLAVGETRGSSLYILKRGVRSLALEK